MATRVTRKGQVTIPKRIRDYLRIEPGSLVDFEVISDRRVERSWSRIGSTRFAAPRPPS